MIVFIGLPHLPECDFCTSSEPRWEWPCTDIVIPEVQYKSNGPWAACDECNDLLLANNWVGLVERALVLHPAYSQMRYDERQEAKLVIWRLFKLFRTNRTTTAPELIR